MKPKELPPVEVLRELFNYCPTTGVITRRTARQGCKIGEAVGTQGKDGYIRVHVTWGNTKKVYYAHRLSWCLYYGEDPVGVGLDHINRIRTDNRIENLRLATQQENLLNRTVYGKVKEKYILTYHRGGYRVYVNNTHVGIRQTLDEAIELRDEYLAGLHTQT